MMMISQVLKHEGEQEEEDLKMDEKGTMNENPLMPQLPEEIIKEIHSRLPPKSLLKFRCVSKPWSVLYDNPKLIEMMQINFIIMIVYDGNMYYIDCESLSSSSSSLVDVIRFGIERDQGGYGIENCKFSPTFDMERIHCPDPDFEYDYGRTAFVGCCNGLVCLDINDKVGMEFRLWNPSSGECKLVPNPPDQFEFDDTLQVCMFPDLGYGFGYDSKSDDYKFVCFTSDLNCKLSAVQIYSLKSDSWKHVKRIHNIPWLLLNSQFDPQYAVFCNGALHWQSSSSSKELIALDMTDELVRGISPPENSNFEDPGDSTRIGMLDGCLSMLYSSRNLGIEVWLMMDYGEKESWTKIYSISKLTSLDELRSSFELRRIKCLKSGEMLLEVRYNCSGPYSKALVLYDPKNETSTTLMENEEEEFYCNLLSFHCYVKSTVSVQKMGEGFKKNKICRTETLMEDEEEYYF